MVVDRNGNTYVLFNFDNSTVVLYLKLEKLPQFCNTEMPGDFFIVVDHLRTKGFFVSLPLEDFFFYRASLQN